MATDQLVQLQMASTTGSAPVERTVVVCRTIPLLGLHMVLQLALKPGSAFSSLLQRECTFQHGDRKPVRGLKSTLLYDMFPDREVVAGRTLNYTCEGKSYTLVLEKVAWDSTAYYVPRCVGGKDGSRQVDLTKVNAKLYNKNFTKGRLFEKKKAPSVYCARGTPAEVLNQQLWDSMSMQL